jgi:hypothetical protein
MYSHRVAYRMRLWTPASLISLSSCSIQNQLIQSTTLLRSSPRSSISQPLDAPDRDMELEVGLLAVLVVGLASIVARRGLRAQPPGCG